MDSYFSGADGEAIERCRRTACASCREDDVESARGHVQRICQYCRIAENSRPDAVPVRRSRPLGHRRLGAGKSAVDRHIFGQHKADHGRGVVGAGSNPDLPASRHDQKRGGWGPFRERPGETVISVVARSAHIDDAAAGLSVGCFPIQVPVGPIRIRDAAAVAAVGIGKASDAPSDRIAQHRACFQGDRAFPQLGAQRRGRRKNFDVVGADVVFTACRGKRCGGNVLDGDRCASAALWYVRHGRQLVVSPIRRRQRSVQLGLDGCQGNGVGSGRRVPVGMDQRGIQPVEVRLQPRLELRPGLDAKHPRGPDELPNLEPVRVGQRLAIGGRAGNSLCK